MKKLVAPILAGLMIFSAACAKEKPATPTTVEPTPEVQTVAPTPEDKEQNTEAEQEKTSENEKDSEAKETELKESKSEEADAEKKDEKETKKAEAKKEDGKKDAVEADEVEAAEITLWTYPIGAWKDADTVNGFIAKFNEKYPNIKVKVEYLDYQSGDDQVTAAIEAGTTPDLIMEGPERLVSNWGAKGKMVDLKDLWTEDALKDIEATSSAVVNACRWTDGAYYEYPLCMTTHTMAINKELFEKADALKYIDEKTRTWTTEDFEKALKALKEAKVGQSLIVYCGGQGGDQGTRALAANLYGAKFSNAEHTAWTMNSPEGVKAIEKLVEWDKDGLISHDAGIQAADELQLFANGTVAMTLCWNASNEANYASQVEFTPYPVAFPSDQDKPELCGGIWGFGIFDSKDEAKIEAAKKFIQFVSDDEKQGPESIKATGFFPVRKSFGNVYAGTEDEARMETFATFMPFIGDYYNVTPGWAEQRTAWWNMLQQVFGGDDVPKALDKYVEAASAK